MRMHPFAKQLKAASGMRAQPGRTHASAVLLFFMDESLRLGIIFPADIFNDFMPVTAGPH